MKFIAHRGNVSGMSMEENWTTHILKALSMGFDAEIDVWYVNGLWYLGHNFPQHLVPIAFLLLEGLWIHCKNIVALNILVDKSVNCFFHSTDAVTLTSQGYLWTYPGKKLYSKSIAIVHSIPDYTLDELRTCYGVCSDNVQFYREVL